MKRSARRRRHFAHTSTLPNPGIDLPAYLRNSADVWTCVSGYLLCRSRRDKGYPELRYEGGRAAYYGYWCESLVRRGWTEPIRRFDGLEELSAVRMRYAKLGEAPDGFAHSPIEAVEAMLRDPPSPICGMLFLFPRSPLPADPFGGSEWIRLEISDSVELSLWYADPYEEPVRRQLARGA